MTQKSSSNSQSPLSWMKWSRHRRDMSALQYPSLDPNKRSIRLLKVLPDKPNKRIRCCLSIADLDNHPKYTALSYAWGRGGKGKEVECDGVVIKVGRNLRDFLREFREWNGDRETWLWIDAVCIDQNNIAERNHQVAQMRDVYSMAECGIAWLGVPTGDEGLVFLSRNVQEWDDTMPELFKELLKKPYWSRLWVVQEFLLTQSLQVWCGAFHIDAGSLYHKESLQVHLGSEFESARATAGWNLLQYRTHWKERSENEFYAQSFRLRPLLQSFARSLCSENYDKVYGLLGIAYDATQSPNSISPDYQKTPVEVFMDVLRNQKDKRLRTDPEEYEFVESLRIMLGISRIELIRYCVEMAPDIGPYMFVLATGMRLRAKLHIISRVVRLNGRWEEGSGMSRSEIHTFESYLAQPGREEALQSQHCHRWHLGTDRMSVRSYIGEASRGFVECMVTGEATTRASGWRMPYNLDTGYLIDKMGRSIAQGADYSCADIPANESSRQFFAGTNGVFGIVFDGYTISTNLSVAVFPGAKKARHALLLAPQGSLNDWYFAGVATLVDLQGHMVQSGDFAAANSVESDTWQELLFQDFNLVDLLSLYQSRVIDQAQLQDLLEDALRADGSLPYDHSRPSYAFAHDLSFRNMHG